MESIIKAATIPVILVLLIASSWSFLTNGLEGAFITSWVSLTLASIAGYIGGQAIKVSVNAVRAYRAEKPWAK